MKPFNLEKALAGNPVITRDGRPVKIAGYNEEAPFDEKIVGWIQEYGCCYWGEDGTYHTSIKYSEKDIFMAPTERKEWVILWTNTHGGRQAHVVNFLENAQEYKEFLDGRNFTDISIHEITIHD
jgi:hypothetical protein